MARQIVSAESDRITVARAASIEPASAVTVACLIRRNGAQNNNAHIVTKTVNYGASLPYVSYSLEFEAVASATRIKFAPRPVGGT